MCGTEDEKQLQMSPPAGREEWTLLRVVHHQPGCSTEASWISVRCSPTHRTKNCIVRNLRQVDRWSPHTCCKSVQRGELQPWCRCISSGAPSNPPSQNLIPLSPRCDSCLQTMSCVPNNPDSTTAVRRGLCCALAVSMCMTRSRPRPSQSCCLLHLPGASKPMYARCEGTL
jgi:hypothetical protein